MKKFYIIIATILIAIPIFSVDIKDLELNTFVGFNISNSIVRVKGIYKNTQSFNVAYSSILPAYGVYSIKDNKTGKEALVQIGEAKVYEEPFNLYLPDTLYKFFASSYGEKVESINLKIKYVGSLRKTSIRNTPEIFNMVIDSDNSLNKIIKNGLNVNYIQIGSFSQKHNALPVIGKLMSYFKPKQYFYIMKVTIKENKQEKTFYRVVVGPYDLDQAKKIVKTINNKEKLSVFVKTGETIIDEYTKK